MSTSSSKQAEYYTLHPKHEDKTTHGLTLNTTTPSTTASSWSRSLKNPRIVRALGGKDRHSKVATLRGLRDRRIRLSVPIALQLYDLQDRLGLNQPSKVVDWLLNAAKHDINQLPPLQMPSANFAQTQMLKAFDGDLNYWSTSTNFKDDVKCKEVVYNNRDGGRQYLGLVTNNNVMEPTCSLSLSHRTEDDDQHDRVPLMSNLSARYYDHEEVVSYPEGEGELDEYPKQMIINFDHMISYSGTASDPQLYPPFSNSSSFVVSPRYGASTNQAMRSFLPKSSGNAPTEDD